MRTAQPRRPRGASARSPGRAAAAPTSFPTTVRTELPRAVEAARKAGLATPMLITSINGADTPGAEVIFDTMRKVGITRYRAPNYRYDYTKDMQSQFDALKPRVEALAKLNEKYGVTAMFHTHSSQGSVGGGLWDLWLLIRDYPPNLVAINYDIGHNTVRGGTEWNQTARYAHRHVGALSLKDMHWIRRADAPPDTWAWRHEFVVPGEGMVNFRDMFTYFKSVGFSGPLETVLRVHGRPRQRPLHEHARHQPRPVATRDAARAVHLASQARRHVLPEHLQVDWLERRLSRHAPPGRLQGHI